MYLSHQKDQDESTPPKSTPKRVLTFKSSEEDDASQNEEEIDGETSEQSSEEPKLVQSMATLDIQKEKELNRRILERNFASESDDESETEE